MKQIFIMLTQSYRMDDISHELPPEVLETIRLIGRKWAVNILHELTHNPLSFSELRNQVKGISASVLSDLLNEFINNNIIEKRIISTKPNRSAYFITEFGEILCEIIESIMAWGSTLMNKRAGHVSINRTD